MCQTTSSSSRDSRRLVLSPGMFFFFFFIFCNSTNDYLSIDQITTTTTTTTMPSPRPQTTTTMTRPLCQKPRPKPSQAGARPSLAALARPRFLQSRSRLRPGQSRGFLGQAGPSPILLPVRGPRTLAYSLYLSAHLLS
jgi:hypothetical protein